MDELKITGWTVWGDNNYNDITHENFKKMAEYFEVIKIPTYAEIKSMPFDKAKALTDNIKLKSEKACLIYSKECADDIEFVRKIREAVIQEIKKHNYHFSGDYHQHGDYGTPIINDTYIYCVSCREWGQIIAEAYPYEDYSDFGEETRYLKWAWSNSDLGELSIYPN